MSARPRTAIVTDSTACIPPEVAARLEIEVVPVHLILGGRTFADSLTADTKQFYEMLSRSRERPTTAAPSPGMFLEAIGRAGRRADSVVCITVSKQFSAMYDSARQAMTMARAESPPLDVHLVDSRNAAMAQGFVVLEAARTARAGGDAGEVVARAEEMSSNVTLLAMLDTLTYLARGGRVPRVAAWAAGMLQLKPIVRFDAERVRLAARTRTRQRALDRLASMFGASVTGRDVHVAVHHASAGEDAERLATEIQRRARVSEIYVTEFTQVMGVHTGPGLVGLAWWCE